MRGLARWRGLRRLFSVYPRGLPGAGLFVLRMGVGLGLMLGGTRVDAITVAGGALLVAGFLTPIAALSMAVALAVSLSRSTLPLSDLSVFLLLGGCVALALLGPGSWSLDARLFGRREVVIPRRR